MAVKIGKARLHPIENNSTLTSKLQPKFSSLFDRSSVAYKEIVSGIIVRYFPLSKSVSFAKFKDKSERAIGHRRSYGSPK